MSTAFSAVDLFVHGRIVIVVLQLAYQAWWIWLLFYTNDCPGRVGAC